MNYGHAINILENIDAEGLTDNERMEAIMKILDMAERATINAVTKDALVNAVRYLVEKQEAL